MLLNARMITKYALMFLLTEEKHFDVSSWNSKYDPPRDIFKRLVQQYTGIETQ